MAGFIDSFTVYDINNANTTFSSDIQGRIGLYTYTNDFSNNLPVYKNSSDYYIFYSDISYGWQWRKLSDAVQDNSMNFNIQNPPPYNIAINSGPGPGVIFYSNGTNGEMYDATISPENFVIKAGFGLTESTDENSFYVSGRAGGFLGDESLRVGTYTKYVGGYLGTDTSYNNNLVFTNNTYFIYLSDNNGWQWVAPASGGNPFTVTASQLGSSTEVKSCRDVVTYSKFLALNNNYNSLKSIPSGLPKTPISFVLYDNNNGSTGSLFGIYTIDRLYNGAWAYKRISPDSNGLIYFSVPSNTSLPNTRGWQSINGYSYGSSGLDEFNFFEYNNAIDFLNNYGSGNPVTQYYLIEDIFKPANNNEFKDGLDYYFDSGNTEPLPSGVSSINNIGKHSDPSKNNIIELWDTENVTDMNKAFENKSSFNQNISRWNTEGVTNMANMFNGATSFNNGGQRLTWNTQDVTDIRNMFLSATSFNNGDTSGQSNNPLFFNLGNVQFISSMFDGATSFNQDLGFTFGNTLSKMQKMFQNASLFNGNINTGWDGNSNTWNVTDADNMSNMFNGASSFNKDISSWSVSNVTDFRFMFKDATSFNENIRGWDASTVSNNNTTEMFKNTAIVSNSNYQNIPNGWVGSIANGSPNNTVFFSNIAPLLFFTPNSNLDFVQGLNYYFDSGTTEPLPHSSTGASASNVGKQSDSTTKDAIETWNTQNVTDMTNAFQNKSSFNQDLSDWAVGQVEKMQGMFLGASSFNNGETGNTMSNPLDWSLNSLHDTITTTPYALQGMFQGASSFNQRLGCSNWDVSNCSTFSYMFNGCNKLSDEALAGINTWNTQKVHHMHYMFKDCNDASFVKPGISYWNTNSLSNMNSMFYGANNFNENISTKYDISNDLIAWDVSGATDKQQVFLNAHGFNNGDLSGQSNNPLNWNIGDASNLQQMFSGATSFNQPIDFSNVIIDMSGGNTYQYKQWDVSGVKKMGQLFNGCSSFNQSISKWDTQKVEVMNEMFKGCTSFNQDLTTRFRSSASPAYISWNIENVEEMYQFLMNATSFNNGESAGQSNKPLNWNINSVKASKFYGLFKNASSFNQSVDTSENEFNLGIGSYSWLSFDVSGIDDFHDMFKNASSFNQPLTWQTDSAVNMKSMFEGASSFNQNLSYTLVNNNHVWNMENVKNIQDMFKNAISFNNGDTAFHWNILSISGDAMTGLFYGASSFNQDINTTSLVNPSIPLWDVSQVTHFSEIFDSATSFNNGRTTQVEPFNWNTEKAVEMSLMFHGATSFNQDVQDWFKQGKLLDMSNAQVPVPNNGLKEMFQGATSFAAFAREWVIPNGISYEEIFDGATDMSNIFYPGRSDTSYNSTPGYNFFNYDVQNDPGLKYNISYPNYYEDTTFAIILPVTSDISGDAYIEIPYNLVFGNIDISSSTPTPNADTISVSSNVDISGAKNLNYTQDSNNENRTFLVDLPLKHNGNTLVTLPLEITVQYGLLPVPPEPPIPPPQKSGRKYACSNKRRFGCPAYMANSDKNGGLFSGNTNQPNFMAVEAYKYSNLVNFSSRRQSMKTQYIPLQLNVFGKYEGAPGGSGMRLKNKF